MQKADSWTKLLLVALLCLVVCVSLATKLNWKRVIELPTWYWAILTLFLISYGVRAGLRRRFPERKKSAASALVSDILYSALYALLVLSFYALEKEMNWRGILGCFFFTSLAGRLWLSHREEALSREERL